MADQKKFRALVVEDQEMFRIAVADELTFLGFDVEVAENGEEGLRIASGAAFDLILSDIRMPVKDGQWFLRQFRSKSPMFPPFVFMTGFADLAPAMAFSLGADGFLAKPINQEKLERLIKKLCHSTLKKWEQPLSGVPKHTIKRVCSSPEDGADLSLGRGGMFVKITDETYKVGDVVEFDITFTSSALKQIQGFGTVVWKRPSAEGELEAGVGIDFDSFSASTLEQWHEFLKGHQRIDTIPLGHSSR